VTDVAREGIGLEIVHRPTFEIHPLGEERPPAFFGPFCKGFIDYVEKEVGPAFDGGLAPVEGLRCSNTIGLCGHSKLGF
jgi:hypothetical protein